MLNAKDVPIIIALDLESETTLGAYNVGGVLQSGMAQRFDPRCTQPSMRVSRRADGEAGFVPPQCDLLPPS